MHSPKIFLSAAAFLAAAVAVTSPAGDSVARTPVPALDTVTNAEALPLVQVQSRSDRRRISEFLDEYRFTRPAYVDRDRPRFFVEACRSDRLYLLMFSDDGQYFGQRRLGACPERRSDTRDAPSERAVTMRELEAWFRERNYTQVRFTDDTAPDRVAEACLDGTHYTVRFDSRGNATRSRNWFSSECSRTRASDDRRADRNDGRDDRRSDRRDNRFADDRRDDRQFDDRRADRRDQRRDDRRAERRDDRLADRRAERRDDRRDDRRDTARPGDPDRQAIARSLRRNGYDTIRFDRRFATSGLVQACQGVRRFRLRLDPDIRILARRVDGFCAENVGRAEFVPPRPSSVDLDDRDRRPLDPERCARVIQWLENRNPITFDTAEDRISRDSEPLLRTIADNLERCQRANLRVTGHTDSIGPRRFNLTLSRDRAMAVKRFLERRGTPTGRLVTEGFGEQYPVVGNLTEENRARNRRINLILEWGSDAELGFAARRDDRLRDGG